MTAYREQAGTRRIPAGCWFAASALLAGVTAGCGSAPVYGPPGPGGQPPTATASASLRLFEQAETGPLARAFQADAAAFNRDSRDPRVLPAALGTDAYQMADALAAWLTALRGAPVPPEYQQAKGTLLRGLGLLQQGYQQIGDGLTGASPAEIDRGRADVRAGTQLVGPLVPDASV